MTAPPMSELVLTALDKTASIVPGGWAAEAANRIRTARDPEQTAALVFAEMVDGTTGASRSIAGWLADMRAGR